MLASLVLTPSRANRFERLADVKQTWPPLVLGATATIVELDKPPDDRFFFRVPLGGDAFGVC